MKSINLGVFVLLLPISALSNYGVDESNLTYQEAVEYCTTVSEIEYSEHISQKAQYENYRKEMFSLFNPTYHSNSDCEKSSFGSSGNLKFNCSQTHSPVYKQKEPEIDYYTRTGSRIRSALEKHFGWKRNMNQEEKEFKRTSYDKCMLKHQAKRKDSVSQYVEKHTEDSKKYNLKTFNWADCAHSDSVKDFYNCNDGETGFSGYGKVVNGIVYPKKSNSNKWTDFKDSKVITTKETIIDTNNQNIDALERLYKLKQEGAITEQEFNLLKSKFLF